jgi:hypothetical protein
MWPSASMVIMSHLSDLADITFDFSEKRNRINFIKFLIFKYPDTRVAINPDAEYELFLNRNKQ